MVGESRSAKGGHFPFSISHLSFVICHWERPTQAMTNDKCDMENEAFSIGSRLLFLFVADNHSSIPDGPAFGRRQEEHSSNAAPAGDEIYAPGPAAVIGSQQCRVVDRRFGSACAGEEGRRPSARRVEELASVSGLARYAE